MEHPVQTMRQIRTSNKEVRGFSRRKRALRRWADGFEGWYPDHDTAGRPVVYKIPVHIGLVEGRQATRKTRAFCSRQMLRAAAHLIRARPASVECSRVVVLICLPDMFSSEVCIYTNATDFLGMTTAHESEYGATTPIEDRLLSNEWKLDVPVGFQERGFSVTMIEPEGRELYYSGEYWWFGELD
jgi:hypothetical protein